MAKVKQDESFGVTAAIQQPAVMQAEGNMAANWKEFRLAFEYFLIASGKNEVSSKEKCALFIHCIGRTGREILEELDLEGEDKQTYETLLLKFNEHCDPKKNINYERHVFFEIHQKDQCFDKFLSTLKIQSRYCEFGTLKNSLILTQVIRGLKDGVIRERLLSKSSLSLEEAVVWCRAAERAREQAAECSGRGQSHSSAPPGTAQVERVQRAPTSWRAGAGAGGGWQRRGRGRGAAGLATAVGPRDQRYYRRANACHKCNQPHRPNERCPATGVTCYRCDKIGHFAKCCRGNFVRELQEEDHEEFSVYAEEDGEDVCVENGELLMHNISINSSDSFLGSWCANIDVNGTKIMFKLDTGADASVMSMQTYLTAGFDVNKLYKCKVVLREISKNMLPMVGYFYAVLKHDKEKCKQRIYVLKINCNSLLGLSACVNLKLLYLNKPKAGRINKVEMDESIFEGIGCLPTKCTILIDKSVPPVVNATRKIPIKLAPRLKQELDKMVIQNIICKEEGPTDWVSSIVIVEKPDKKLRICLDPRNLNRAVKRSHFQLPTLEEIASNLAGAKFFSKCDAKSGFWMLELEEASSKLCTFSTPYGRYRFLRMPFGINCAPEIFHNEMYKVFKIEGVEVFLDDVLIWGKTREEHDERLREVIKRAKENGVKFNKEKCVFGAQSVKFLGHTFDVNGIRPDHSRVEAILKITTPKDKKELERFLGVTNYLSRFIPQYSETSAPLRELLGKNIQFEWLTKHENAFVALKNKISSAPVLRFYSPTEPVTLSVDASSHGLGACLMQGGRPVAYAARTLTPAETRWAQIEKEMLAVVFGCVRFHQYVYGHDVITVESDHKPLEAIFKKQLNETPARLQRMLLKLQNYPIALQYKPGKLMFIADTLSRSATEPGTSWDADLSKNIVVHVNMLYENVDASPEMLSKIKYETENDSVIKEVCKYYSEGWPELKNELGGTIKRYWDVHEELHVVNGILFRNARVVIPTVLRQEMLRRIHEGHLGVEKCQRRAREVMWWPGMSADIAGVVQRCEPCQQHRAAQPREPLRPHPIPELPWEILAADIFEFKSRQYLLVVDYYSKFIDVSQLPSLQSSAVIVALKNIFSRFGIPVKLVSDNGTQFTSAEFKTFSKDWGFRQVTSSPHYPRSNGLAERNVRTVKSIMLKAQQTGQDWQLGLLNFRNTPITGEQFSPAQLLMSRRLNTTLPASKIVLQPKVASPDIVQKQREQRTGTYKKYYDRGTRSLLPLKQNDTVRMRHNNVWVKSKVKNIARGDRSYWVETDAGGVYRRNRQHLMKVPHSTNVRQTVDKTSHLRFDDFVDREDLPPTGTQSVSPQSAGPSTSSQAQPINTTRYGRVVRAPDRFVN